MNNTDLKKMYTLRFTDADNARKNEIWKILVRDFFQKFVGTGQTVIDAACGHGEFINNISAQRKIAVDLNEDAATFLSNEVEFRHGDAISVLADLPDTADVVFTSNFLEHLPDKKTLNTFLDSVMNCLKADGKYIVLGPNLRYLPGQYWDFYDHELGLTHLSLVEALQLKNFSVSCCIDKFLPYTTKSKLPSHPLLVKAYLMVPPAWKILGRQFFIVAEKQPLQHTLLARNGRELLCI